VHYSGRWPAMVLALIVVVLDGDRVAGFTLVNGLAGPR
jgi:hypothetical protein